MTRRPQVSLGRSILRSFTLVNVSCASAVAFAGSTTSSGIPNPSSKVCTILGGALVPVSSLAGESSLCSFSSDGGQTLALVDSWTLFRAVIGKESLLAVEAFRRSEDAVGASVVAPVPSRSPERPNPASLTCQTLQGTRSVVVTASGRQWGLCRFADGSTLEEWTLYRGATDATNAALNAALDADVTFP